MKKKIKTKSKFLIYSTLKFIFFCIFSSILSLSGKSQQIRIGLDTLLTGNLYSDSIKSESYFERGKNAYDKGQSTIALDYFQKCIYLREALFPENHVSIAFPLNRAGVIYKDLGRLNEAIECYQKVIKIYSFNYGEQTYRNGTPYSNLGNVFQQKGNLEDAITYHRQAIINYENGLSKNPDLAKNISSCKFNLADNLFQLKRYEKALEIILGFYETTPYYDKASFLNLLGNIYFKLGDVTKASKYFELSVKELKQNAENSQDTSNLADLYVDYGKFLISINNFDLAQKNLESARLLIKNPVSGRDISNLYFTYGELYSKKIFDVYSLDNFVKTKTSNLNSALLYFQKAIIALCDNYSDMNPASNPTLAQCKFQSQILKILQRKAETFYELSQIANTKTPSDVTILEHSLAASQLASDLLNNLRTGTVSEESKIVMTQLQNSSYLFAVKVAYELFSLTHEKQYLEFAFHNAERNKAASLLDNLADESARKNSLLPDSIVQREEDINDQVSILNQKLFEENQSIINDSSKIKQLEDQIFILQHEKNDLVRFLELNYQDYFKLKYSDDKISVLDVQRKLAKDEVIIEYIFDKPIGMAENLYIIMISKSESEFKKVSVDSAFFTDIDIVYRFISASDFVNIPFQNYKNYLKSAHNLYKFLIEPFNDKIFESSVTIIPDGKINYIPFDALLSSVPGTIEKLDFKNLDYLVKKYLFNYSYSASLYSENYKANKSARHKLIAFAPEYGSLRNNGDDEFNRLAPLSGISEEVKLISKYIKSKDFNGNSATESNFMKYYQNYDILHLAMHAIINDSLPMFSKLAFSPETDSLSKMDGWLTTSEIYNLKLNSRLSVLSACNTGNGTLLDGEGVISLARGFLYAGCPSIVMTLWEVEDRSGAEIMGEFYRLLRAGKKTNQALRMAKLKHIESANPVTAHPHVWLSYVTIGKTDALYKGNDLYFFIIIVVILLGIISDQLYKMKKARKNQA